MANLWLPQQTDLALALREPNLLVPGQKPVGPVIASPVWNVFDVSNGANLVGGKHYQPGSSVTMIGTSYGLAARFPTIADDTGLIEISDLKGEAVFTRSSLNFTFVADFEVGSSSSDQCIYCLGWENNLYYEDCVMFFVNTDSNNQICIWSGRTNNLKGIYLNKTATVGERIRFCVRVEDNACTAYINGVKDGITDTLTGGSSREEIKETIGSTCSNTLTTTRRKSFAGNIRLVAYTDHPRPPEECRALSIDPYKLLKPANSTPYLISVPTGGATVTLSSPTATATSSTTATVGCTVTYT